MKGQKWSQNCDRDRDDGDKFCQLQTNRIDRQPKIRVSVFKLLPTTYLNTQSVLYAHINLLISELGFRFNVSIRRSHVGF